jgi:D-proline reductase (dithiol) PrdB
MQVSKGNDPAYRTFVSYIDKSREFYAAQGFEAPYRWAHFDDVPFTPLWKPLESSVLALITTASLPLGPGQDRPPVGVFSVPNDETPASLYTDHRSWDKDATHTEDLDSFFPIHRLQEFESEGCFRLAPRWYGVPTEYSQRLTKEKDAPEVLRLCREDGVDAAVLVPL